MKLDFNKFPTIKNLAEDVREKALEYAATLGARGPRPTTVLGTAVTLAKEWKSGRLPARPLSAPFLVQPRQGRWVIKRSTDTEPSHTFSKKDDAVRRAQELAKSAGAACFVFGPGGTLIERYEAKALAQLALVPPVEAEVAPVDASAPEVVPVQAPEFVQVQAPEVVQVPAPEIVQVPAPEIVQVQAPEIVQVQAPEIVQVQAPEVVQVPIEALASEVLLATEPEAEQAPVEASQDSDGDELPSEGTSGEDPIRVKKLAGKWMIILGDGRSETLSTQKKAVARAKALAKKLGRGVQVA